jgi:hypothetical protein
MQSGAQSHQLAAKLETLRLAVNHWHKAWLARKKKPPKGGLEKFYRFTSLAA